LFHSLSDDHTAWVRRTSIERYVEKLPLLVVMPGGPEDVFALAERADKSTLPALRIDCGLDDFLLQDNRRFHQHLEKLGIAHEYAEHPDEHNWEYWDLHVQEAIAFFARVLGIKE